MSAAEVIHAVEQAGGTLRTSGDRLKVSAPLPLSEPIMTELRTRKAEVIEFLKRPVAKVVLLHCPSGVPEAWVQSIADLLAMAPPTSYPAEGWAILREDSYTFLRDHAARAHDLGWTVLDLFGVHPEKPWVRFDYMGLIPLLSGAAIVALSDTEAVIEKPNGARLTFHKRGQVPDETCLLWSLK